MPARPSIQERVERAAEAALADHQYVGLIDIFTGIRLLEPVHVEDWRKGRIDCSECGVELLNGSLLSMEMGQPLCLACAGMEELQYLPAGDTALTRRATQYSARRAVVVRFSRSRGRYERQGVLVEEAALNRSEQECTEDAAERAAARARAAQARREQDRDLVTRMTGRISEGFPGCPASEAEAIARHTAVRGSGRVGRTAAGQALQEQALTGAGTSERLEEVSAPGARAIHRSRARWPRRPPALHRRSKIAVWVTAATGRE